MLAVAADGRLHQLHFGAARQDPTPPPRLAPDRTDEFFPCYGNGYLLEPALQANVPAFYLWISFINTVLVAATILETL